MFISGEISFTHLSESHGIFPILRDIHRSFEIIFEFKFLSFYRDYLYNRHFNDKFLRILPLKQSPLEIPASALQIQPNNITAILRFLSNILDLSEPSDLGIKSAFVQGPLLAPAGGLHQGCEVGFGDVEARQPHHFGLSDVDPVIVLLNTFGEVAHPGA